MTTKKKKLRPGELPRPPDFVKRRPPPKVSETDYATCVANEAGTLLSLYMKDPRFLASSFPEEFEAIRSALIERLAPVVERTIQARYRRGLCTLCKGPAEDCAPRHAEGKSCA